MDRGNAGGHRGEAVVTGANKVLRKPGHLNIDLVHIDAPKHLNRMVANVAALKDEAFDLVLD